MSKRAHHRSDEEWHRIILAARSSGLNDFEYCRSNGIPHSTFYRALARLRLHACEIPARAERPEYKLEVVSINISELPSVFKYLQAVLLYMPDYVHEPEGIEELMSWSDKMKKLCALDTKATIEDKDGNP